MDKSKIKLLRDSVETFIEDCKSDLSVSEVEDPHVLKLVEQIARHTTSVFDDFIKVLEKE